MTTDEKDRLEIVERVCNIQDCTLQEIYNFIKTGKASNAVVLDTTPADGVYLVMRDGLCDKFTGANLILDCDNPVIGIGVKQGDRGVIVALKDVADGDDVTLTIHEDTTNYSDYILNRIDAVADWNGKANTAHLREIGLNPAIALNDGEYIPSIGEMHLIYTHRREINAALRHVGGMEIADKWYLTSTEHSAAHAWYLHLNTGRLYYWGTKASEKGRVRPVSAFNFNQSNNIAAQTCAKHLRLKSRITEKVHANQSKTQPYTTMLYTVKVQVKILGIWVTVWAETCDYSDGDTRPYIKNCAEEVHEALTDKI